MEDRSQLPPDLPIQLPPSPLGDKYNVILALPSRMRQALMAVFHTSSFGLLIKPPEEDCSRIGQTFSSHTGRTSGLPFCSVKRWRACNGTDDKLRFCLFLPAFLG